MVRDDDRDHGGRGFDVGDSVGVDGEVHGLPSAVTWRGDVGGSAEDAGEDERVQRAPGVELPSVDVEAVRGGAQCEAAADDAAVFVVFGVGHGGQGVAHLLDGGGGGVSELVDGDRRSVGEEVEQRAQHPGRRAGVVAAE
ncbi:Uncharacterised protein [Mycobacteroides abscessus]|nr:Uncharacterised protein [Mycobacteroides abscessus]